MRAGRRVRALLQRLTSWLARAPWRTGIALGLLVGGGWLAAQFGQTRHTIPLRVNGMDFVHYTQRQAGDDVIGELGIVLGEYDRVEIPSADSLAAGAPIEITIARHLRVIHDGTVSEIETTDVNLARSLTANGIALGPADLLSGIDGNTQAGTLAAPDLPQRASLAAWVDQLRVPVYVSIRRAVSITVSDDGIPCSLTTTADTVSEALTAASIMVYEADRVIPSLDSRVLPGLRVEIQRAQPVTIEVDGRLRTLRTRVHTVGAALAEAGVALDGEDRVAPGPETEITKYMNIAIVRVYDEYYVEEVPIAYETVWQANPDLEIDQRRTANWGKEGALRQQVRVHYENGAEVSREEGDAWVAREPEARVIEYGTAIVVRQLDTPDGPIEYWRKLRMLATSYNAATAGKPTSSPTFGLTRLGEPARKGVIAVDPSVIALRQPMYVPGYGLGFAGDTGSAIKNRRVDLCFDDHNLELWYRWVDVYLLTPVPPASQITWVVPNTPVERE